MIDKIWDAVVHAATMLFIPFVCNHFEMTSDLFFNGAYEDSRGIEWAANQILAPCQYLLVGKKIAATSDGDWAFTNRFEYAKNFELKTALSCAALAPSFVIGVSLKALCLFDGKTRDRFASIHKSYAGLKLQKKRSSFDSLFQNCQEIFISKNIARRPGDENHLMVEKKAFQAITKLLTEEKMIWWADCGTCLGVYRHAGVIPWDEDLDIALLQMDFENTRRILNRLDRKKYLVQDWSTRECPNSLLKVFIRETSSLIDIYFFNYNPETQEIRFIFSFENSFFFPEWWKIRERRFQAPIAVDKVFPLKKGLLDGIEVFIPNDIEKYLQRYYGENLAAAKIYDPVSDSYIKDLTHPYWQNEYVH